MIEAIEPGGWALLGMILVGVPLVVWNFRLQARNESLESTVYELNTDLADATKEAATLVYENRLLSDTGSNAWGVAARHLDKLEAAEKELRQLKGVDVRDRKLRYLAVK